MKKIFCTILLITFIMTFSGCMVSKAEDIRVIEAWHHSIKVVTENTERIPDEDLQVLREGIEWGSALRILDNFESFNRSIDSKLKTNKNYKLKPNGNQYDYVIREAGKSDIKKLMESVGEKTFYGEDLSLYNVTVNATVGGKKEIMIVQTVMGTGRNGKRVVKDMTSR